MKFVIELLSKKHDRQSFDCGNNDLNQYLYSQVGQDVRKRVTTCYLALSPDGRIAGYFTLASTSVLLNSLPEEYRKKLPKYPLVPAVRMGRLAVHKSFQERGLGSVLLSEAFKRVLDSEIAVYALVVDAKDVRARSFYEHFGFIALPDQELTLFVPIKKMRTLL